MTPAGTSNELEYVLRSKRKRNEVQVYVTIKPKRLSQRFEESEEGDRQIRCHQHNPEKTKHRCSPENRRSNGESYVVQGSEEQVGGEPSFFLSVRSTAHTKASQNSTGPRAT